MICTNCQNQAKKAYDAFTFKERVQILTSTAIMLRNLEANVNSPSEDRQVANSIATKILLSIPEPGRTEMLRGLRMAAGIDITLKNCPHGLAVVQ